MLRAELESLRHSLNSVMNDIGRPNPSIAVASDNASTHEILPPSHTSRRPWISRDSHEPQRKAAPSSPIPLSHSATGEVLVTQQLHGISVLGKAACKMTPSDYQPPSPSMVPVCMTLKDHLNYDFANEASTTLFERFNTVFEGIYNIDCGLVCLDEKLNQDTLIRGVLRGWDNLQPQNRPCPLWGVLRSIDEGLFILSETTTRLSMLRAVHFMLLVRMYHINDLQSQYLRLLQFFIGAWTCNELPPWYRPR